MIRDHHLLRTGTQRLLSLPISGLFVRGLLTLLFVAVFATFAAPAQAATITVSGFGDTLTNNGVCTIREAIINANNDAATWMDCAAGSGTDTIVLPAGTITLSIPNSPSSFSAEELSVTGDLDITSSMIINGNMTGTVIDGGAIDRIFDINPDTDLNPGTPSITVAINSLTITNGYQNDVGAVRVQPNATVTMDGCTVSNSTSWANDAGGIGILSGGTLTMTNCTVSGNHALLLAGGIKNEGTTTLISCLVTNSTSSFTNLITGVLNSGTMTLGNTIIAGNSGIDSPNLAGSCTSLGYNIIGSLGTSGVDPIPVHGPGDQVGVSDAAVQLGALANNGGPTPTHALGAGSIAIDQGNSFMLTGDQRGQTRPCDQAAITNATGGDGADVGAFEVQGACVPPNSAPDAVDDPATVEVNSGSNVIDVLNNDTDPDMDTLTITTVTQGANGSVANNGTSVSYTPNMNFIGPDSFTYTIDDGHGHTDTATVNVSVVDTVPPALTASVAESALWSPNHELINVGLSTSASDNSGGAVTINVAVFSDEDDLAPDSGNFSPDARNIAPGTLRLRSERSGSGDGRVYLIVVSATDPSHNVSRVCLTVVVPKSQSQPSIDSVNAQATAAQSYCASHAGGPPPGYFAVGDGPVAGPKQ